MRAYHAAQGDLAALATAHDAALSTFVQASAAALADPVHAPAVPAAAAAAAAVATPASLRFAPAELQGRVLDLQPLHARFLNLPLVRPRLTAAATAAAAAGAAGAGSGASAAMTEVSYMDFLSLLAELSCALPASAKLSLSSAAATVYLAFLQDLCAALGSFHARTRPLAPPAAALEAEADAACAALWAARALPGWFPAADAAAAAEAVGAPPTEYPVRPAVAALLGGQTAKQLLDASNSSNSKDNNADAQGQQQMTDGSSDSGSSSSSSASAAADALGLDSNPLFCVACDKLFPKQTVFDSHLTGKNHRKNAEKRAQSSANAGHHNNSSSSSVSSSSASASSSASPAAASASASAGSAEGASFSRSAFAEAAARLEFRAAAWCALLRPVLEATLLFLDKRRTASYAELAAGALDGAAGALDAAAEISAAAAASAAGAAGGAGGAGGDEDDEDAAGARYNPLDVPLGWDGNPIPFWLYKLHQLNLRFECEICGGESFRGTRAYYQHFREWRHTYFLKALGIPNSEHFVNVAKVDDARALHARLQRDQAQGQFRAAQQEEVEDMLGNVYSKGAYDDLKSKGLII